MSKFEIGDKVNFVVERSLLSGVITKFYKNPYGKEECSIKTEIKTFPHILLQRVKKIGNEDDLISKIANLEAKLAESEKKYKNLFGTFKECQEADRKFKNEQYQEDLKLIDNLEKAENDAYKLKYELAGADETISQLKQQLAEKESELKEYHDWLDQYHLNPYQIHLYITGLKVQLVEKEKEVEELKKFDDLNKTFFDLFRNAFKEPNKVDDLFNTLKTMQDKQDQDKISFAVEQVIKTKETLIKFLQDEEFYENEWYDLFDKIDNQIKQLKGVR